MTAKIYENLSFDDYVALPGVRAGHLKVWLSNSPEKAAYKIANTKPSTPDQVVCQAVHAAVFEGLPAMHDRYSAGPDLSRVRTQDGKPASNPAATTQGKAIIADFYASNPGVQVIGEKGMHAVLALHGRFAREDVLADIGAGGRGELTIVWDEEVTMPDGSTVTLPCKARIDWYDEKTATLTDGKGALVGMSYDWRSRTMGLDRLQTTLALKHGWHVQLAHYRAGLRACGLPVERVQLALYDQKPPHEWLVVPMGENVMDGDTGGDGARTVALQAIARGPVSIRELCKDAELDVSREGDGGGFDLEYLELEGVGNE